MPSPATLAAQGLDALDAGKFAEAITCYTEALASSPESPDYYLKRSTAHQRLAQYDLALHDAELAVFLAHRRGKRELIGTGQLRRGMALMLLNRYGDARFCFDRAEEKCSEKEKRTVGMWKEKLRLSYEKVDQEDIKLREATVQDIPTVDVPTTSQQSKVVELGQSTNTNGKDSIKADTPKPQAPVGVTTAVDKIRHDFYQTPKEVVVSLVVKGVPQDKAAIEITENSLSISFPLASGSTYSLDLEPLYDDVIPQQSSYRVMPTKIEAKLVKSIPNKTWPQLEGTPRHIAPKAIEPKATTAPSTSSNGTPPAYPTSSKSGPKDWDKVAKELTTNPKKKKPGKKTLSKKAADKESKDDADDESEDDAAYGSDYEGGDPVNHFFKKLYQSSDEDTRRAMMKSYVESNGTSLSTNWKEVGKDKVETSPPEGMIAKKWGE